MSVIDLEVVSGYIGYISIEWVTHARVNDSNLDSFAGEAFLSELIYLCHEMRCESIVPGLAFDILDIIRASRPSGPRHVLIRKLVYFIWPHLLDTGKSRKLPYVLVDTLDVLELDRHTLEQFMVDGQKRLSQSLDTLKEIARVLDERIR